ncbi:MAG: glycosyltransferase family 2 protein [Solirubrobacteraceae bacterium]|nr:glycosyltransferase family 2 protein [Solirubrobacteraceae bacterium]
MTRVSIILPTRDRPAELDRALRSVLAQTMTDWHLHLVDDGSADPVQLDHQDDRITVLRHDVSRGVAAARNAAIAAAEGEWIAFLDDDDVWSPDKLARQLEGADGSGASFIYGATILVGPDGRVLRTNPVHDPSALAQDVLRANVVGEPSTVMVRHDLLADAGFAEDLSIVADWDLWIRLLLEEGATAWADREARVAIVEHAGSMQIADVDGIERELAKLHANHRDRYAEAAITVPTSEMRLYLALKRWQSRRTAGSTVALGMAALRQHDLHGTASRLARRARARRTATPAWLDALVKPPGAQPAA